MVSKFFGKFLQQNAAKTLKRNFSQILHYSSSVCKILFQTEQEIVSKKLNICRLLSMSIMAAMLRMPAVTDVSVSATANGSGLLKYMRAHSNSLMNVKAQNNIFKTNGFNFLGKFVVLNM
jgi:hypothetical protein